MDNTVWIAIIQSMPIAILLFVLIFFVEIKQLLKSITINSIMICGVELKLNTNEVKATAEYLFKAMNKSVQEKEWKIFSTIVSNSNSQNDNTVAGLLQWDFKRDEKGNPKNINTEENLKSLRALRGFGLIEPGGQTTENKPRWENESVIKLTAFGKYVSSNIQFKRVLSEVSS